MKRSYEYLASTEKRRLDMVLATAATPLVEATRLVVQSYLGDGLVEPVNPIFQQTRVGKNGNFSICKFLTLNPETGEPFNDTAAKLRKVGLDELAQIQNVRVGTMSFVGWRPIIPEEYESFRENLPPTLRARHDTLVANSRPGMISSYGIYSHIRGEEDPNEPEIRAEMNLKDVVDASLFNDFRLIKDLMSHAAARRFQ